MSSVEIKAKTVEDAVSKACDQLGTDKDNVTYTVLEEIKGLFGKIKEVKVLVSVNEPETVPETVSEEIKEEKRDISPPSELAVAENFLESVIEKMDISASVSSSYDEENAKMSVDIEGKDVGIIIGRHGETLDALQYLTNVITNKKSKDFVKVTLDAENYRAKRKDTLVNLANKTARKAVKYARNMTIEPMNPYERRIIHETLQGYPDVTTYSVGKEPNRKVVVAYNPGSSEEQN